MLKKLLTTIRQLINQALTSFKNHPSYTKYAGIAVLVLTLTLVSLLLITHTTSIELLRHTNSTPVSTTLIWYTQKPALGCVYLIKPFPKRICDDHHQGQTNHHITINKLKPNTTYTALAQTALTFQSYSLTTSEIPEQLPANPNPAYGRIFLRNDQPLPYATVIAATDHGRLSTLTDSQGYWSLDLSHAYSTQEPKNIPLVILYQNIVNTNYSINSSYHQPVPNITLNP